MRPMLSDPEFADWFRLLEAPGLSRQATRGLLAAFGSPEALWRAGPSAWRDVAGPAAASCLVQAPPDFDARLARALQWRQRTSISHFIPLGDPAYPELLLHAPDPPFMLYAHGEPDALGRPAMGIVGSRSPTPQGRENARAFARALGMKGNAVVSGLALGIDAAAHEGALDVQAATVAVLGHGLDTTYPRRHEALAQRIVAAGGLLLSDFAPGTPALPPHFPARNRIIAGLSQGVLVVEAALQSGSLITARLAAEAGREVLAIPGSIHSPQSRGCHALIRQGATLVENVDDILAQLGGFANVTPSGRGAQAEPQSPAPDDEDPLISALGFDPIHLDALAARTGWSVAALGARLLELELAGQVARLPGGLFTRMARG